MTKFELVKEYHQLYNQVQAAANTFDGSWDSLYKKWNLVASKLLDEMDKMKRRENETHDEYIKRRRRLHETIFGN